jgi:hypothetical protein
MIFRYARHTVDLKKIEKFYTEVVGLQNLGGFEDHDGYHGLFLGHNHLNWHLEFTTSHDRPKSTFDADDALVFYVGTAAEMNEVQKTLIRNKINLEIPKNPYWTKNGVQISDPDGFKVVFSIKHQLLPATDRLTALITEQGIENWSELIEYTRKLPYGRNQNREDFSLVVTEGKGTCSSKHSFLKKVADLNGIDNVKLILGIYRMNQVNTPKIGTTISESSLEFVPEAHCYLKLNNRRVDITTSDSNIENLAADILEEIEIEPEQVGTFKVEYHKKFLQKWLIDNDIDMNFNTLWELREQCIRNLEQ